MLRFDASGTPPSADGGMSDERIWTAALVVIGDEILSGRTHDKNIAQVASWLQVQGIRLTEVRVVPDVEERIVEAVNALRTAHDYLFTTGGIGPTHDDITVDAVAKALGLPVVVHPEARRILEDYYATRGGLTDARLRMARVPEGADLIPNRMSGAPGIRIGNVHLMAGVPHITAQMLDALTGTLEGGAPLLSETVGCWVKESEVADILREVEKAHANCPIGSYPFFRDGKVGANFVIRSTDPDDLASCVDTLVRSARRGRARLHAGRAFRPVAEPPHCHRLRPRPKQAEGEELDAKPVQRGDRRQAAAAVPVAGDRRGADRAGDRGDRPPVAADRHPADPRGMGHRPRPSSGSALTAALVGMAFGSSLGGWLGDRWGRLKALYLAALIFGASTIAAAYANDVRTMALVRVLGGLGFGAGYPNALALVNDWVPARHPDLRHRHAVDRHPARHRHRRLRRAAAAARLRLARHLPDLRRRLDRDRHRAVPGAARVAELPARPRPSASRRRRTPRG